MSTNTTSAAEEEDAALQALCGSLGLDLLRREGMEAEIKVPRVARQCMEESIASYAYAICFTLVGCCYLLLYQSDLNPKQDQLQTSTQYAITA
eukprot:s980_g21.t1